MSTDVIDDYSKERRDREKKLHAVWLSAAGTMEGMRS
jgi:hypothetical protein